MPEIQSLGAVWRLLAGGPVAVAVQAGAVARISLVDGRGAGGADGVAVLVRRHGAARCGRDRGKRPPSSARRCCGSPRGAPESAGTGWSGQAASTRAIASFSGAVTDSANFAFTATWRARTQRWALLGGSHVAASPSPFCRFAEASTASRFTGSVARAARLRIGHRDAPLAHALPSATTWSMSIRVPSPYT